MTDLLDFAVRERIAALGDVDARTQGEKGQFFTPVAAAELIASMVRLPEEGTLRVLDPGAGSGVLSAALIARILRECPFDVVIENPPYGKFAVSSSHRKAMRASGIDAPNLYAAFLSLSIAALKPSGPLVAITPRSFFNGPYFGPFRAHLLDSLALDRIHVFDSRSTVFADTGVLQENVIFAGTRDGVRDEVELSVSRDHTGEIDVLFRTTTLCSRMIRTVSSDWQQRKKIRLLRNLFFLNRALLMTLVCRFQREGSWISDPEKP